MRATTLTRTTTPPYTHTQFLPSLPYAISQHLTKLTWKTTGTECCPDSFLTLSFPLFDRTENRPFGDDAISLIFAYEVPCLSRGYRSSEPSEGTRNHRVSRRTMSSKLKRTNKGAIICLHGNEINSQRKQVLNGRSCLQHRSLYNTEACTTARSG